MVGTPKNGGLLKLRGRRRLLETIFIWVACGPNEGGGNGGSSDFWKCLSCVTAVPDFCSLSLFYFWNIQKKKKTLLLAIQLRNTFRLRIFGKWRQQQHPFFRKEEKKTLCGKIGHSFPPLNFWDRAERRKKSLFVDLLGQVAWRKKMWVSYGLAFQGEKDTLLRLFLNIFGHILNFLTLFSSFFSSFPINTAKRRAAFSCRSAERSLPYFRCGNYYF